jgi:hypothetical protein
MALDVALHNCQEFAGFQPLRDGRSGIFYDAAKSNDKRSGLAFSKGTDHRSWHAAIVRRPYFIVKMSLSCAERRSPLRLFAATRANTIVASGRDG